MGQTTSDILLIFGIIVALTVVGLGAWIGTAAFTAKSTASQNESNISVNCRDFRTLARHIETKTRNDIDLREPFIDTATPAQKPLLRQAVEDDKDLLDVLESAQGAGC